MPDSATTRWLLFAVLVLAIVALLGYARGDDGDDGRSPEREDSLPVLSDG